MEISHREGVGLKPIPQKNWKPAGVSERKLKPKETVKSLLLEKAGFETTSRRKLTLKVSFLFFLERLLGKPFK